MGAMGHRVGAIVATKELGLYDGHHRAGRPWWAPWGLETMVSAIGQRVGVMVDVTGLGGCDGHHGVGRL